MQSTRRSFLASGIAAAALPLVSLASKAQTIIPSSPDSGGASGVAEPAPIVNWYKTHPTLSPLVKTCGQQLAPCLNDNFQARKDYENFSLAVAAFAAYAEGSGLASAVDSAFKSTAHQPVLSASARATLQASMRKAGLSPQRALQQSFAIASVTAAQWTGAKSWYASGNGIYGALNFLANRSMQCADEISLNGPLVAGAVVPAAIEACKEWELVNDTLGLITVINGLGAIVVPVYALVAGITGLIYAGSAFLHDFFC